jgi:hypothetical protein
MRIRNAFSCLMLVNCLCAAACDAMAQGQPPSVDKFAEIGARQTDYRNRNLVETPPPALVRRVLPLDASGTPSAFQPGPKITTAEQLRAELERQRAAHAPFLKDLAPPLEDARLRVPLSSFDWRIESAEDRADFAATLAGQGKWQRVKIPHYGGPLGQAVTYYRTAFELTRAMLDKGAVLVRFKGVDYKAHVFVNGALLGSHEGLFAPFEFDFTVHARPGKNFLLVKVENDFTMLGNSPDQGNFGAPQIEGDKIGAGTSPGWDEPEVGWHACPPGMGIYQDVTIEARRPTHVHDVFVRPLPEEGKAEAWIEVFSPDYVAGPSNPSPGHDPKKVAIEVSVYGQNFPATVLRGKILAPLGSENPGAEVKQRVNVSVEHGVNCHKIPLAIPRPRCWEPGSPWLYQLQVRLLDDKGHVLDTAKQQFGMRSFRMEYVKEPKGRMYLNGKGVKLRGINTMGSYQQCVMRKDWQQLIDDILLAKITHVNYMRLTDTPVQPEIYDYCDRLGLMLQTDLPMFAQVKRNQFCEVVRQAEEMERLVRSHPSNIMLAYIDEPFPNASGAPYRNLTRPELTNLFAAADMVVRMANPDRVIKAVDGDYDPPGPGLPDNHCYPAWYNGHGVELGALHKGHWLRVKPGWVYGCGEFGAEGLDSVALMRKHYPKAWLPQTADEEKRWSPSQIPGAQTGDMHYNFFETPQTLAEWVQRSQSHQAWATRLMTEAFRRDGRMHSFAIHLFIDAFPASWMKSIMDCDRQPKPAWFAYREALMPLAVSLRTDRRAFFAGEPIELEAWVCNDLNTAPRDAKLHYQIECDGKVLQTGSTAVSVPVLNSAYQGTLRFQSPTVSARTAVTVRLGLLDAGGQVLHDTSLALDIFQREEVKLRRMYVIGDAKGKAAQLAESLGVKPVFGGPMRAGDAILIDDMSAFAKVEAQIGQAVHEGARAVFLNLKEGKYRMGGSDVVVGGANGDPMMGCKSTGLHFVSRATGHRLVEGFRPDDFKFWYNAQLDRPSPLLTCPCFKADGWEPILLSFNAMAAGSKADGKGQWCVCQIELADRTVGNPVAAVFARRLLAQASPVHSH